jgi:hypothetical protein
MRQTVLKNIVQFTGLAIGVPTSLPHGLNVNDIDVAPKLGGFNVDGFTATADLVNVTVTRGPEALSGDVNVYVEHWHTIESVLPLPGELAGLTPFFFSSGDGGGVNPAPVISLVWRYGATGADAAGANVYSTFADFYRMMAEIEATKNLGYREIVFDNRFVPNPATDPNMAALLPFNTAAPVSQNPPFRPVYAAPFLPPPIGQEAWDLQDVIWQDRTMPPGGGSSFVQIWDGGSGNACRIDNLKRIDAMLFTLVYNGKTVGNHPFTASRMTVQYGWNVQGVRARIYNTDPTAQPMWLADINPCFMDLQADAQIGNGTALPAPVVEITGVKQLSATVITINVAGPVTTLSSPAAAFVATDKLRTIITTGFMDPKNNGTFQILAVLSATQVQISTDSSLLGPPVTESALAANWAIPGGRFLVFCENTTQIWNNAFVGPSSAAVAPSPINGGVLIQIYSADAFGNTSALQQNFLFPLFAGTMQIAWNSVAQRWRPSVAIATFAGARSGTGDSFAINNAVAPGVVTLTDAANAFVAADVGRYITITGALAANTGTFQILSRISGTQITLLNYAGVNETSGFTWAIVQGAFYGDVCQVDSTAGAVAIQLPKASVTAPTAGTFPFLGGAITVLDVAGLAGTNPITVLPFPGDTINLSGAAFPLPGTAFSSKRFWTNGLGKWFAID